MPLVARFEGSAVRPALTFGVVLAAALVFAVLAALG